MKYIKKFIVPLIVITAVVLMANWKLIFMTAAMKWDVADFHLPSATYIGDCLRHGILPLWNPMINYGYPQYAQIGDPLWYPTTLLFGLLGYNLRMLHFEYIIHVILAGYFMYLFVLDILDGYGKKENNYFVSLICGLIYCFSGMFFSNAEHLMIIISATWIPLIFLFIRRYIYTEKKENLLLCGLAAGMNILGGYPGLFFILFVIIIPFIVYNNYLIYKFKGKVALNSIKTYVLISIFTVLSCSISLIPFINSMKYISRGVMDYNFIQQGSLSFNCIITMLLPGISKYQRFIDISDISMINMYSSLLIVTFLPYMLIKLNKKNIFYIINSIFAFTMLLGSNAFLHPIFYKFVPFFNTFRFPALWKIYMTFFLIICFAITLSDLINNKDEKNIELVHKIYKYIVIVIISITSIAIFLYYAFNKQVDIQITQDILGKIMLSLIIILGYKIIFRFILNAKFNSKKIYPLLILLIIEILTFHYSDFYNTIAEGNTEYVTNLRGITDGRNKNIDFNNLNIVSKYPNTTNREIIYNKLLEEEGYNSFNLKSVKLLNQTYYKDILLKKPVIYFSKLYKYISNTKIINELNNIDINDNVVMINNGKTNLEKKYTNKISKNNLSIVNNYDISNKINKINNSISLNISNIFNNNFIHVLKFEIISKEKYQCNVNIKYIDSQNNILKDLNCKININNGQNEKKIYLPSNIPINNVLLSFNRNIGVTKFVKAELLEVRQDNIQKGIKIEKFEPNRIDINIKANAPGYVVIQQAMYSGWKAYDNGKLVNIDTANYIFKGIKLGKGNHKVKLVFEPKDFYLGAFISICYLILCIFCTGLKLYKKVKRDE